MIRFIKLNKKTVLSNIKWKIEIKYLNIFFSVLLITIFFFDDIKNLVSCIDFLIRYINNIWIFFN